MLIDRPLESKTLLLVNSFAL